MIAPNLPQWLVRLAVVVAVPGMACFGYYSLVYLGDEHASWSLPVLLAYPAALIGLVSLASALLSPQPSKRRLWLSAFCFIMPVVFLLVVRT